MIDFGKLICFPLCISVWLALSFTTISLLDSI